MRAPLARNDGKSGRPLVSEIRFHRAVYPDGERDVVAILGRARGDANPALADAIFLYVGLLDALEADADITRKHRFIVIGAFRIGRETVGQLAFGGFVVLAHSKASISFVSPSGFAVGACRATTVPERSTRNLVKFHLMDE